MTRIDESTLEESLWFLVTADGAKTHWVPKGLVADSIATLESKGYSTCCKDHGSIEPTRYFRVDYGGCIMQSMPTDKVKIDTLEIEVWCHQMAGFLDQLQAALSRPERTFDGRLYYRLFFDWTSSVLVLTADQMDMLHQQISEMEPESSRRSDEFLEGKPTRFSFIPKDS